MVRKLLESIFETLLSILEHTPFTCRSTCVFSALNVGLLYLQTEEQMYQLVLFLSTDVFNTRKRGCEGIPQM